MAVENEEVPFEDVEDGDADVIIEDVANEDEDLAFEDTEAGQMLVSANEGSEDRSLEEIEADIAQIEALANMSPEVRDMPEYKNLVATAEKVKAAQDEEGEGAFEEDEEEEEEEGEEEEGDTRHKDDVFGLGVNSEEEDIEFEVSEEMSSFIENHYGIDDPTTFFASVDNWRNQSQDGAKVRGELDELTEGLQSLPSHVSINNYHMKVLHQT